MSEQAQRNDRPDFITGAEVQFRDVGGTGSDAFNTRMLTLACRSLSLGPSTTAAEESRAMEAVAGALHNLAPTDAVEGMIASLMVATHEAAMHCCRRAMSPDETLDDRDADVGNAADMAASFAQLVEALTGYREMKRAGAAPEAERAESVR